MPACLSPYYVRSQMMHVPCGRCNYCLAAKRADWTFRLKQEMKVAKTASFLTLTYDVQNLPVTPSGIPELKKTDWQKFMKRLRKLHAKVSNQTLRYYSVGEYGTLTARPHYHSILFNLHESVLNQINSVWGLGYVDVGKVTPASIHYVTKYVINRVGEYRDKSPPFSVMSNRSGGIGKNYLVTNRNFHLHGRKTYVVSDEVKQRLPRYYRDKIFANPATRQLIGVRARALAEKAYDKEIIRLSKLERDPYAAYEERLVFNHNRIKNKVNEKNKL